MDYVSGLTWWICGALVGVFELPRSGFKVNDMPSCGLRWYFSCRVRPGVVVLEIWWWKEVWQEVAMVAV